MKKDAVLEALRTCQRTLRRLKSGDQLANEAENAFSKLADTVETVLEERRVSAERRRTDRGTPDRRRARKREG